MHAGPACAPAMNTPATGAFAVDACLAAVVEAIADPLLVIGTDYRILLSNRAAREVYGLVFDADGRAGQPCHLAIHGRPAPSHTYRTPPPGALPPGPEMLVQLPAGDLLPVCPLILRPDANACLRSTQRQRTRAGERLFEISAGPLRLADGSFAGIVEVARDVTTRAQAEGMIEYFAYHDQLTGLPNRLLLQERFAQARRRAELKGGGLAMLFIDIDRFKTINDTLGHAAGDALLREVVGRLREHAGESDTICRLGADEFLVLLADGAAGAGESARRLLRSLDAPFSIEGHVLHSSASIGVSLYPDDGDDFAGLLKAADIAMYSAKAAGRNAIRFFDAGMSAGSAERLRMQQLLREALARKELHLHYQPQFDLADTRLVGVEALLRWQSPELGAVPPDRFIPLAEDSGLIVPIGRWVLTEACRQAVAWQEEGLPPLVMAVNLSAIQFARSDVAGSVAEVLAETGLAPALLELELTESVLLQDDASVGAAICKIKALGVRLAIDDFGTGYSSLSYLKRFAAHRLKIDRSFVRDMVSDLEDATLVRAIIQMANALNMSTIAEGVEDGAQAAMLVREGCASAQGYLFGRPAPAAETGALLRRHASPALAQRSLPLLFIGQAEQAASD